MGVIFISTSLLLPETGCSDVSFISVIHVLFKMTLRSWSGVHVLQIISVLKAKS